MNDETRKLVETAEDHLRERRSYDACRCFEEAAGTEQDNGRKAQLWQRAGDAHANVRSTENARRCYQQAAQFLDGQQKADCLLAWWRHLLLVIAGCQWDCSFEWRGETDGSHDDDHEYYQAAIARYREEAVRILRQALSIEGINARRIIKEARRECKRREKDGWGAQIGWSIVAEVTGTGKG